MSEKDRPFTRRRPALPGVPAARPAHIEPEARFSL